MPLGCAIMLLMQKQSSLAYRERAYTMLQLTTKVNGKLITFPLVQPPEDVKPGLKKYRLIVKGEEKDFTLADSNVKIEYTDEHILQDIKQRMDVMEKAVTSVMEGNSISLIITGPPGVGKTHTVNNVARKYEMLNKIGGNTVVKHFTGAHLSKRGLFDILYEYQYSNCVCVFDDSDKILLSEGEINLLKSATDSYPVRTLTWSNNKGTDEFNYRGRIVFISNMDFDKMPSKLQPHVNALKSRSSFIEIPIWSNKAKLLYVFHLIREKHILRVERDITLQDKDEQGIVVHEGTAARALLPSEEENVMQFLISNLSRLRSVDIRMAQRCQELISEYGDDWKSVAEITLLDSGVRY
jgi:DNA polymerase III delta prime subunit